MNQKLRQVSNNSIEKDFYELINNSNLVMIVETVLTIVNLFLYLMNIEKYLSLADTITFLILK